MTRVLASTRCPLTASICGYDAPVDHREDGQGWSLSMDGDWFVLNGPDGEVRLDLTEGRIVADEILRQVAFAEARAAA